MPPRKKKDSKTEVTEKEQERTQKVMEVILQEFGEGVTTEDIKGLIRKSELAETLASELEQERLNHENPLVRKLEEQEKIINKITNQMSKILSENESQSGRETFPNQSNVIYTSTYHIEKLMELEKDKVKRFLQEFRAALRRDPNIWAE